MQSGDSHCCAGLRTKGVVMSVTYDANLILSLKVIDIIGGISIPQMRR
jgi:hypothetical protein